ncbi:MAG: preprotein translocase subunit SecG [Patescibacteria group bacterium]
MQKALFVIQLISAVCIIATILVQNRGTGLSATFGGEGNVYRTKRGVEKFFFTATIVLAVIFFGSSLISLVVPS